MNKLCSEGRRCSWFTREPASSDKSEMMLKVLSFPNGNFTQSEWPSPYSTHPVVVPTAKASGTNPFKSVSPAAMALVILLWIS
jgi:hypothetical protein